MRQHRIADGQRMYSLPESCAGYRFLPILHWGECIQTRQDWLLCLLLYWWLPDVCSPYPERKKHWQEWFQSLPDGGVYFSVNIRQLHIPAYRGCPSYRTSYCFLPDACMLPGWMVQSQFPKSWIQLFLYFLLLPVWLWPCCPIPPLLCKLTEHSLCRLPASLLSVSGEHRGGIIPVRHYSLRNRKQFWCSISSVSADEWHRQW